MRLTIFWRVILAQSVPIGIMLLLGVFALKELHGLADLTTSIVAVDSACVVEEKRLLKSFLSLMRNAEKYTLLKDPAFHDAFLRGSADVTEIIDAIDRLVDTRAEKDLLNEIKHLQVQYRREVEAGGNGREASEAEGRQTSREILERINELIRLREQMTTDKVALARDQAASAAAFMSRLTLGGIVGALLLACLHAVSVSRPIRRMSGEMRRVGKGEFDRSVELPAPKELHELALTFNTMTRRLAELEQLKSDFTAHVSHELRTPLTAIREGTALLLEQATGPLAPAQREVLEVVRDHTDRLFHTILSILDLSKMEAEMLDYHFVTADLADIVQKSLADMELIARKKGIDLWMNFPDRTPTLLLDEMRIRQVMLNLLSNALKFAPEGGRVRVSASVHSDPIGDSIEVRVSDNGEGIPGEEIERVFERYYQGARGAAKSKQGTGLGLAIARHIIEAHKGRIWAESAVGLGTTIIFSLPVDGLSRQPSQAESTGR